MEGAMTQSDAGAYRGEQLTKLKDVTDYHGQLLEQLRHVEDNIHQVRHPELCCFWCGRARPSCQQSTSFGHYYHRGIAQHKLCRSGLRPGCKSV